MFENYAAYLIGIYFIAVTILFLFPRILHGRRTFTISNKLITPGAMKIIAHRGGKEFFNENSLSAFSESLKNGVFGLELDVFSTKDKQMVVLHDRCLFNATGQDQNIDEVKYDEICNYKTQYKNQRQEVEKPPLFEDVLKLTVNKNVMINIDIKSDKDEDIVSVCDLIQKYDCQTKVVVGCIMNENCKTIIKKMNLHIPTFFNRRECLLFFAGLFLGFLPFIPFQNDVVEVPFNFSDMEDDRFLNSSIGKVLFKILNFCLPVFRFFNRHMNRRGIPVIYWTLNCQKDWQTAINTFANGIITDCPTELKQFVVEKNRITENSD